MKKLFIAFIFFIVSVGAFSQEHLSFYGIPLNTTIKDFTKQFKSKNIYINSCRSQPNDKRWFRGIFVNYDADIAISFNPKTKIVYSGSVYIEASSLKAAESTFYSLSKMVENKYKRHEFIDDSNDREKKYVFGILSNDADDCIGMIGIKIFYALERETYAVNIYYTDALNFLNNEEINKSDF